MSLINKIEFIYYSSFKANFLLACDFQSQRHDQGFNFFHFLLLAQRVKQHIDSDSLNPVLDVFIEIQIDQLLVAKLISILLEVENNGEHELD